MLDLWIARCCKISVEGALCVTLDHICPPIISEFYSFVYVSNFGVICLLYPIVTPHCLLDALTCLFSWVWISRSLAVWLCPVTGIVCCWIVSRPMRQQVYAYLQPSIDEIPTSFDSDQLKSSKFVDWYRSIMINYDQLMNLGYIQNQKNICYGDEHVIHPITGEPSRWKTNKLSHYRTYPNLTVYIYIT